MWQLQWGVGNRVVGHGRAGKSARTRRGLSRGTRGHGQRAIGHLQEGTGTDTSELTADVRTREQRCSQQPPTHWQRRGQRADSAGLPQWDNAGRRDVAWHGRRHRPWGGQWANCRHATKRPGQRGWARAAKAKGPSGPEQPPLVSAGAPTHVNIDRAGQGRTARTAVRTAAPHQHNGSSPASVPHQ